MLRRWVRKLYQLSIGLGPRSDQPYATHVPVLVGVAAALKPKRLIEFGSGSFSTLSFLDDVVFPSLEEVRSYENNEEWFKQIQAKSRGSSRVDLQYFAGDMYRAVAGANVAAADMIFLDDSPSAEERVKTVKEVSRLCGDGPIAVIHDYEMLKLRLVAHKFEHCVAFEAFNPQCCAVWHGHPERRPILEDVSRTIQQHAGAVPPTDARAWIEVFTAQSNGSH
jgi:hypothetical protein